MTRHVGDRGCYGYKQGHSETNGKVIQGAPDLASEQEGWLCLLQGGQMEASFQQGEADLYA